jgi:hypothetical protein
MASAPNNSSEKKTKSASTSSLAPPDERFWKRYSPHHEFPISSSASVMIHVLGLAVLVAGALLLAKLGFGGHPVEVTPIVIAGGGGDPNGTPGPNTGSGHEKEVINEPKPETPEKAETPKETLKAPEKEPTPILPTAEKESTRTIEDPKSTLMSLSKEAREGVKAAIARGNRSKGKGGTGEGGGKGAGKGTGTGDLSGPGKLDVTQREKRQLRWEMAFKTLDGNDYLRQLKALGAILAIDAADGQYLVIEDLSRRPVTPVTKDVAELNRIYWIDDRRDSVMGLARALGLRQIPARIIAFFPIELEQDLLRKELAYRNVPEDEIDKTWFKVVPTRHGYEPLVDRQTTLHRR